MLILSLILLSVLSNAQSAGQGPKAESISPYSIEWLIDISEDADLRPIWRSLKIETPDSESFRCGGNCSAETFDIKTADEGQGTIVALRISFETGEFYRYLLFRKDESWKLIGYADARGERAGPPAHRVESGEGRTWLVIRELWGRGPGAMARGEVWYEIKATVLKRVLSYPVEGYDNPCRKQAGRSYRSLLARHGSENGAYTVPVQLIVSYNISDCEKGKDPPPLFAKGQKAYYVWNDEKGRFVLDTSRSDLTEKELEAVYNLGGLTHEKFLEYNLSELLEIARNSSSIQRDWLIRFLNDVEESPPKTALQRALGR